MIVVEYHLSTKGSQGELQIHLGRFLCMGTGILPSCDLGTDKYKIAFHGPSFTVHVCIPDDGDAG